MEALIAEENKPPQEIICAYHFLIVFKLLYYKMHFESLHLGLQQIFVLRTPAIFSTNSYEEFTEELFIQVGKVLI